MPQFPKIGIMYDFRLPGGLRDRAAWSRLAGSTIAVCRDLDEAGVDGIWLTEHHFVSDGYLPALLPMAAAISTVTTRCDIGTSVLLAPLHHPLALAEAASVVDNLAGGRLILGLGLGYRDEELQAFSVRRTERARRLTETLEILSRAWGDGPVDHRGEFFAFPAVEVWPKPVQNPPRLWLGARAAPAARRAGQLAAGIIIGQDTELRQVFLDAAREGGRDPGGLDVAQLRSAVIEGLLPQDDLAAVAAGLAWRSSQYQQWYQAAADLPQDRDFVSPGTATAATVVRSLAAELEDLQQLAAAGVTYVIYHGTAPGIDPHVYLRQWSQLIAETR
jgi:alkanesulfonate monooxygenase SsuD/methylene tetrahydromethanopterin reductase-like flavin-dependent oxidoreductase (luciferase family)